MTTPNLTLDQADAISNKAIMESTQQNQSIVVVILNAHGKKILSKRMDECSWFDKEEELAFAKANTALACKDSSNQLEAKWSEGKIRFMMGSQSSNITAIGGGALIKRDGIIIGAIGVSGSESDD